MVVSVGGFELLIGLWIPVLAASAAAVVLVVLFGGEI